MRTIFIIYIIIFSIIFGDNNENINNTDNNNDKSNNVIIESKKEKKELSLGDTFNFDDLEITFGKEYSFTTIENMFNENNGKEVVKLPVTIKNKKKTAHHLNIFCYKVFSPNGTEVKNYDIYFDDSKDESLFYAGELLEGASYTKYTYFLYEGDGKYTLILDGFLDSKKIEFEIKK